jgi:organic radical activating enzyme
MEQHRVPPEERALLPDALPVVETFHSLQGEGTHAGRSAWFLRLAGCTVGCPWCDTKVSWPQAAHPQRATADLAAEAAAAAAAGAAFAVITGGEPLHHDLGPLCEALAGSGLPLHLETSGVDRLSGRFAWITLSPKRHRPPRPDLLAACDELKAVVHEPADLRFAEAMAAAAGAARAAAGSTDPAGAADGSDPPRLLLQPGWGSDAGLDLAVAFVQRTPAWRLSLQSHKWLGLR